MIRKQYEVTEFDFKAKSNLETIGSFIVQLVLLLQKGWQVKGIISQFTGYHNLLPGLWGKIFGIPMIIVAAGTESAGYPSISYGNFAKPLYARVTRWTFRMAQHVLLVHRSLAANENHYYPNDGIKQGFLNHVPGLDIPYTEIAYGFDAEKWTPSKHKRPKTFVTVAHINSHSRYVLKGIDLIIEMGNRFPDCQFVVIGMKYKAPTQVPSNVNLMGFIPHEELPQFLGENQFFLQLSISEGHPNALCEGMLCGCVPIASAVTSMPEIVGDTGFLLEKRDPDALEAIIKQALSADLIQLSQAARSRMVERYPLDLRRQKLLTSIQQILDS